MDIAALTCKRVHIAASIIITVIMVLIACFLSWLLFIRLVLRPLAGSDGAREQHPRLWLKRQRFPAVACHSFGSFRWL
jgi:hypothetical protein